MTKTKALNHLIAELDREGSIDTGEIRDGWHSFDELYRHRNLLFVHLCKTGTEAKKFQTWRSVKDVNGKMTKGWFIMGIHREEHKQITYRLPIAFWEQTHFADTFEKALHDGHTPDDVIQRLIISL